MCRGVRPRGRRSRCSAGYPPGTRRARTTKNDGQPITGCSFLRSSPAALCGVPDVEQDFEVELLATIREVEGGHLLVVARALGALERLAVHLVQVVEDSVAAA